MKAQRGMGNREDSRKNSKNPGRARPVEGIVRGKQTRFRPLVGRVESSRLAIRAAELERRKSECTRTAPGVWSDWFYEPVWRRRRLMRNSFTNLSEIALRKRSRRLCADMAPWYSACAVGFCVTNTTPKTRFKRHSWYWPARQAPFGRWNRWDVGSTAWRFAPLAGKRNRGDIGTTKLSRATLVSQIQTDDASASKLDDCLPLLDEELNRLSERERLPIVLCDLMGRSRKEAAEELELSEGTLSSRLARGRDRLRSRLQRPGRLTWDNGHPDFPRPKPVPISRSPA